MECANRRVKREKKLPRVPIKTYKWEDVNRSRRRGGYPWTHLYKEPFYESLDPEPYTMEGMRKAKSSSTMGKSDMDISEVSTFDNQSSYRIEEIEIPDIEVKDPQNHSIKTSCSSLILDEEECDESDAKETDDIQEIEDEKEKVEEKELLSPGMFFLHSEESLDNISQYLDKEERCPSVKPNEKTSQPEEEEEGSSRKRKMSIESGRSKISFGKQALLQKIKNAKEKIKLPKISFPTKIKKTNKKQKHSPTPEAKKQKQSTATPKNSKPVYIHIPLKPLPGETDEFLQAAEDESEPAKKPGSFKDLVKNLKILQESKIDHKPPSPIRELKDESYEKDEDEENIEDVDISEIDATPVQAEENKEIAHDDVETMKTDVENENKQFGEDSRVVEEIKMVEADDGTEDEFEIIEETFIEEGAGDKSENSPSNDDEFDKLFEVSASRPRTDLEDLGRRTRSKSAEPERKRKLSMESSYSRKSLSKLGIMKKLRDAKDKIKDKLTRSISKKEVKEQEPVKIEQKLKNFKPHKTVEPVYIHIPLKPLEGTATDEFSSIENEPGPSLDMTETTSSTPDSLENDKSKGGVQFIFLTAPSDDEILDYNSSDVPETPSSENKLFFPSKVLELKEIAKGAVDEIAGSTTKLQPVTEENGSPRGSDEDVTSGLKEDVKKIEKSCVEDVIRQVVEQEKAGGKEIDRMTIDEEDGLSENKLEVLKDGNEVDDDEIVEIIEEASINVKDGENINVSFMDTDEILDLEEAEIEDEEPKQEELKSVLKSPNSAEVENEEELKSVLKGPNSPIMKKKVSFKRKVKSKNGSYEEINVPESEETEKKERIDKLDQFQSMPTDEEDVYMEEKKINDISIEEKQRNRWSKISDHEYEPINPPPDNVEIIPTVTLNNSSVCIIDTAQALSTPPPLSFPINKSKENDGSNLEKSPKPQRVAFSTTTDSRSSGSDPKTKEGPSKFQKAFKQKADSFKNKLHNMKRPHINLPERPKFQKPNFQRFKIEKKFTMPKIPDTAKINLPRFSLPHMKMNKSIKRNVSTESNAGDSKKPIFDFGTYPRIFKKKPKPAEPVFDFATVPRAKKPDSRTTEDSKDSRYSTTDSIRIPLHSEDSMEKATARDIPSDSSDIRQPSHIRYNEGIDSEDEYEKENKELIEERDYLSRWQRGRFNPDEFLEQPKTTTRVTDLDSPEDFPPNNNEQEQRYSSGSSLGIHRKGVLEEINPDEFFLRQKGISQDNIEVGMYLSTEIREAFRNPTNALVQMEDGNNFTMKGSHTSLPDIPNKKKSIKKPKRKKTPHASQEQMPYEDEETADDEIDTFPPSRPKRRSRRKKKTIEDFIPYQETIQDDSVEERIAHHRESVDIFADDERDVMYENEVMQGKDQPEIKIINPYKNYGYEEDEDIEEEDTSQEYTPEAPPRRQKSLTNIDNNSMSRLGSKMHQAIFERRVTEPGIITYKSDTVVPERKSYHMNVTQPEISHLEYIEEPAFKHDGFYKYLEQDIPEAPPRKQKSLKSLNTIENESFVESIGPNRTFFRSENNLQEPVIDAIRTDSKIIIPIQTEAVSPKRPSRSRSRGSLSLSASQKDLDDVSRQTSSLAVDEPCVEEPCVQKICDYMGYSVVDKSKIRDPPLPPPRTLGRKKRSTKLDQENKFFTVPRTKSSKEKSENVPVRPLRNYSTLSQNRQSVTPDIIENKENINITQYIEIEDEPSRDLQSGEIIEKMKTRPLPAPPRPPRKTKLLQDITSRENIMTDSTEEIHKDFTGETEVYTQTEPLPDDFVCEEVIQEPTDKIILPTQTADVPRVERRLITPTSYTFEETVTHGSLLVEPLNGVKLLPDSDITREIIVPVQTEDDFDETSSIPDNFHKLTNPELPNQTSAGEIDILKAKKLEVTDLDVDTLTVNKLLAGKIIVSEIDSGSIQTNEISSKSGALQIGEINLPPEMISQILKTIHSQTQEGESVEQKKTPIQSSSIIETSPNETYLAKTEYLEEEKLSDIASIEEEIISDTLNSVKPFEVVSKEENLAPVEESNIILEDNLCENVSKSDFQVDVSNELLLEQYNLESTPPEVSLDIKVSMSLPSAEIIDTPPIIPPRSTSQDELDPIQEPIPHRPPRQSEKLRASQSLNEESMQEPDVDDEPPPRPPEPPVGYIPSQPPTSFYALRAQKYVDDNIPTVPRRRRHAKAKQLTRSSSEDSSEVSHTVRRHHRTSSDQSLVQLTGQLARACGSEAHNQLKRLINYILNNVLNNEDGKQDLNVMIIIILVLIAGLLLLGYGEERTVVHLHHWEYFNPPKNL